MTNTLHRFGRPEDLKDDYVVFTLTHPGFNEKGAVPKAREPFRHGRDSGASGLSLARERPRAGPRGAARRADGLRRHRSRGGPCPAADAAGHASPGGYDAG